MKRISSSGYTDKGKNVISPDGNVGQQGGFMTSMMDIFTNNMNRGSDGNAQSQSPLNLFSSENSGKSIISSIMDTARSRSNQMSAQGTPTGFGGIFSNVISRLTNRTAGNGMPQGGGGQPKYVAPVARNRNPGGMPGNTVAQQASQKPQGQQRSPSVNLGDILRGSQQNGQG